MATSTLSEQQVRSALSNVEDRAGKDVLSTGVVQNLALKEEEVRMDLVFDAAYGMADRAAIEKAIRTALKIAGWDKKVVLVPIQKAEPVKSTSTGEESGAGLVGLGKKGPQPPPPQAQGGGQGHGHSHGRPGAGQGKKEIPGVRNVIAVASGKGGVGKSTVASNLAVALARLGHKVGLLDNDVYGPSLPILFAIHEQPKVSDDRKLIPIEKYGLKLMSLGFLLDEGAPAIWRGPIVMQVTDQLFYDTAWGEIDYLVLDLPPGTGDVQLTLAQKVPLTGAVIVSTPQDISLADAERGLRMFNRVDVPVLGIVENMSYFVCTKCSERHAIFSHGGAKEKAKELGVDFLAEIPIDLDTRAGGDLGKPVVVSHPDSAVAKEFFSLANAVAERCEKTASTSMAARLKAGLLKIVQ